MRAFQTQIGAYTTKVLALASLGQHSYVLINQAQYNTDYSAVLLDVAVSKDGKRLDVSGPYYIHTSRSRFHSTFLLNSRIMLNHPVNEDRYRAY